MHTHNEKGSASSTIWKGKVDIFDGKVLVSLSPGHEERTGERSGCHAWSYLELTLYDWLIDCQRLKTQYRTRHFVNL